MASETIKVLEIDTNPAQTSIKDLRKQLKGFKDEMANLEEGSDAFLEVANKAGQVKHQIDEINESIKGASSDFGDMVGNVTNVAAGITGAFQAVAGGLQAMGVESEAIDQAIAKMQGLMAVTQGLSAIDDGIKSFGKLTTAINTSSKGLGKFKTALIGTGLGALVVVLGSIIANWDEFSKSIGISESAMQKFGDVMKGVLNSALSMIGGVGKAISRLITGDFKGAGEAIKEGFALQKNFQEGVQQAEEERTKKQLEEAQERLRIEKEEAENRAEEYKKLIDKRIEENKRFKEEINKDREDTTLLPTDGLDTTFKNITNSINEATKAELEFIKACIEAREQGNEQFEIMKNTAVILSESSLGFGEQWTNVITDFQKLFNETMDVVEKDGYDSAGRNDCLKKLTLNTAKRFNDAVDDLANVKL